MELAKRKKCGITLTQYNRELKERNLDEQFQSKKP